MTAIKYDGGKPKWQLLPFDVIEDLVKVYTVGAEKYSEWNWLGGFKYSRLIGAFFRHTVAWINGEDYDQETGVHHLDSALWNIVTLKHQIKHNTGEDDRYSTLLKTRKENVQ